MSVTANATATTIRFPDGTTVSLCDWVDDSHYGRVSSCRPEYRPILKPWVHERWAVRATCEIIWKAAARCFVSGTARHNVSNVLHNLRCWTIDLHAGHIRVAARHARRLTGNVIFNVTRDFANGMRDLPRCRTILWVCADAIGRIVSELVEMSPHVVDIINDYRILDLANGWRVQNEDVRWAALALIDVDKFPEAHRLVQDYLAEGGK